MNDTGRSSLGPAQYLIRLERRLGPNLAALFPEFVLEVEPHSTLLRGYLPDQAALHGILERIRDLGLTLLLVARVADPPE